MSDIYLKHKITTAEEDGIVALMQAWEDIKGQGQGWFAYGLFWALIERMSINNSAYLPAIKVKPYARNLFISTGDLEAFLKLLALPEVELFTVDDQGTYHSPRLQKNLDEINQVKAVRSLGGKNRWRNKLKNENIAPANQEQSNELNNITEQNITEQNSNKLGQLPQPSLFEEKPIDPVPTEQPKKAAAKQFIEPTVEEITQELIKRNVANPEANAKKFHASYATKGWIMNNGKKMKSWLHAVTNWETSGWFNAVPQNQGTNGIAPGGHVAPGTKLRF